MKKKNHLRFTRRKDPIPASHTKVFTDEEARILEKDFIEAYSGNSKSTLKILLIMYRRYPLQLLLSVLFYVIATLPHITIPIVTANLINVVVDVAEGKTFDYLTPIIINISVLVVLLLLNIPTNMIRVSLQSVVMRKVEVGLRGALVRKLQQLSISFHKEMQSGRIQSKLMRDVETVQMLSSQLFTTIPQVVLNMITALVVVITRNLTIFAFFIMCIPAATLTMRAFRNPISKNNREFRKGMEQTSANLMDMVEMTQITRAHALENREVHKMTTLLNKVANTGFHLDVIQALFGACSWVIFQLFQLLCLVFSVYLAIKGSIEIGDISMYQSYFSTLTSQVSTLIGLMPIITKGFESISSIGEILGASDIEDNRGKLEMPNLKGEYEFKDVYFSYEDDQPLLRGLNLSVKEGETLAIVGESGSGKSTILNLVLGFNLPKKGEVLVDGEDITKINLHSYRKSLAVVPQNSVMFTGTIRENITYGMQNVDEEKLKTVLDAALLTDFINSLPQGIDTPLEEHGANLSGGQRQRLSIARALIRDPKVIIFDEATSALDSVSEKEIQKAINNLSKDRTTFIVAHRLSTIRDADRIAVIKNGVCAEIGTFEELMEKKGEFYKMQTLQTV
ncbi:MAG: ABC transporter [Clostridiales bacterium]|nr:MAG: ABC transporter [Clostridiales bacterium]